MPTTAITVVTAPGTIDYDGQALTPVVADVANGNKFVSTGKELVIAINIDTGGTHPVTVTSVADDLGRTLNVASVNVAAAVGGESGISIFGPFETAGWKQSSGADAGSILISSDNVNVKFVIVKLP